MTGVIRVLLSLALVACAATYLMAEKTVTLADEGRLSSGVTFAPRVGEALVRLGVKLSPHDRVTPRKASQLDGRIEIHRAKDVLLILNGQKQNARVTAPTVGEALRELGVDSAGSMVEPASDSRISTGEEILVNQPAEVVVVHDGKSDPLVTNAATTGALLRQMGIAIGPHDRVEPSIAFYPSSGSIIKIVRVTEATERVHSKIAFRRVSQKTEKLEYGLRELGTKGEEGIRAKIYHVTYEDGRVVRRVSTGTEVVKAPVDEIVLIGTRRPVFVSHGGVQTGKGTWYSAPGLTAAHRTLPFGTVVRVTNLANGRQVNVVVRDRGPRDPGRVIDLSDIAFRDLAPLARGVLDVKIEW